MLNISPEVCTILVDVVVSDDALTDIEYIENQKKEAETMMASYRAEHGAAIDPKKLIELEYELLRYTAMHHLGKKMQENTGARR